MKYLYNALVHLAAPLAFALNIWRGFGRRAYWDRLGERFGYTRLRFATPPIWIHAVSVGEVQAAAPLVRRLLKESTTQEILITTGTVTGAARVRALFDSRVHHAYLPYDLPGSVRRFLARVQPRIAVVLETELWPNLFFACRERKLPLVLASARISPRTAARYQKLSSLFRETLPFAFVASQTEADADRLVMLGASQARTRISGNIKFDIELAPEIVAAGRAWRETQAAARRVWVAGSTHAGEEDQVLAAHRQLLQSHPDALLVLAPRHEPRFAEVQSLLKKAGWRFVNRSSKAAVQIDTQVFLLDTLGELTQLYAAADIAFVGGSLVPIGGHNLLEPASLGLPVLCGPSMFNAQDVAQQFLAAGAVIQVQSAGELAQTLRDLWAATERRAVLGRNALALIDANRGALERIMQTIAAAENDRAP